MLAKSFSDEKIASTKELGGASLENGDVILVKRDYESFRLGELAEDLSSGLSNDVTMAYEIGEKGSRKKRLTQI